ncbi:glutathione transferase GstA [Simplicispira psychrophila]|uniref:glutathione transferase GstA n=1 Tax=Simplicispira psychrophila TaxID=80882 RepID=UPI000482ABD1|nr:glutathione transferase GstA [Simplicispira psychrophila]
MKLYYSPGACSLSPHIVLQESGLPYEAIAAPTKTHQLADGTDYYSINPLGYVPFLVLDDGRTLREGAVIVQYVADQAPDKKLMPAAGSFERYQAQEWLNFIGTELHKGCSPFFGGAANDEYKAAMKERLLKRLEFVNQQLAGRDYLMGAQFSVADAYLFTITNWAKPVGLDLAPLAHLLAWRQRVSQRPAVVAAMQAEGLLK